MTHNFQSVFQPHNFACETTSTYTTIIPSPPLGFVTPSGGTATVNGYDIRTDMSHVRSSMGLCPQHDVLFDILTVKEHLEFFAQVSEDGCLRSVRLPSSEIDISMHTIITVTIVNST